MSNKYFKIKKTIREANNISDSGDWVTKCNLNIIAIMSNDNHTMLQIESNSNIPFITDTAYIVLNDDDVDKLIFGLLERKLKLISATDDKQSAICPNDDD